MYFKIIILKTWKPDKIDANFIFTYILKCFLNKGLMLSNIWLLFTSIWKVKHKLQNRRENNNSSDMSPAGCSYTRKSLISIFPSLPAHTHTHKKDYFKFCYILYTCTHRCMYFCWLYSMKGGLWPYGMCMFVLVESDSFQSHCNSLNFLQSWCKPQLHYVLSNVFTWYPK